MKQIFGHSKICNTGHGIASQSRESSRRGGMRPSEVQHEAWENYKQRPKRTVVRMRMTDRQAGRQTDGQTDRQIQME